jgi:hypothetical protein
VRLRRNWVSWILWNGCTTVVKGPVTSSWIFGCLIQVEWRIGPGSGAAQKLIELCFFRKPLIPKVLPREASFDQVEWLIGPGSGATQKVN